MTGLLLAIDVGGSTSRATLVDRDGRCRGQGSNRGGNPGSNPPELAAAATRPGGGAAGAAARREPRAIPRARQAQAGAPGHASMSPRPGWSRHSPGWA